MVLIYTKSRMYFPQQIGKTTINRSTEEKERLQKETERRSENNEDKLIGM